LNWHKGTPNALVMPYNTLISNQPMKLFQYDKKTWDTGEVNRTWQFGIINDISLLWVNFESPGGVIHSSGGINILFSFFGNSLMSVDFQQYKFGLAFAFFAEYMEGWEKND